MSGKLAVESANQTAMQKSPTARENESLRMRIQERAYELYDARGRVDGHHEEDWARAESEILERLQPRIAA